MKNSDLSDELKGTVLGLLQEASLKEDIVVLVVNDPQQLVVKWLHNIDKKTDSVQERILKIVSRYHVQNHSTLCIKHYVVPKKCCRMST